MSALYYLLLQSGLSALGQGMHWLDRRKQWV